MHIIYFLDSEDTAKHWEPKLIFLLNVSLGVPQGDSGGDSSSIAAPDLAQSGAGGGGIGGEDSALRRQQTEGGGVASSARSDDDDVLSGDEDGVADEKDVKDPKTGKIKKKKTRTVFSRSQVFLTEK